LPSLRKTFGLGYLRYLR